MIDPRTKALVLNGKPGHLQFYSLQSDKQLYNVRFCSITCLKASAALQPHRALATTRAQQRSVACSWSWWPWLLLQPLCLWSCFQTN